MQQIPLLVPLNNEAKIEPKTAQGDFSKMIVINLPKKANHENNILNIN